MTARLKYSFSRPCALAAASCSIRSAARDEARLDAGHHRAVAERQRDVGLADAAGPEQHHVLGALDERQVGELLDLRLRGAAGVAPVELLQRLDRRHRGELASTSWRCRSSRATISLASSSLQEVGEARFVARGVLRERRPFGGQARELELLAQRGDALVLQVHASTSSSSS